MPRQVTLRGIDDRLVRTLRREAQRRRRSLNRTVLDLLAEATGLAEAPGAAGAARQRFNDLDHLAGTWSEQDARDFDRHLRSSRRIDDDLWR